jgi:hypothetical protein
MVGRGLSSLTTSEGAFSGDGIAYFRALPK